MTNAFEQLQEMTVIVADTGDAELVKQHKPQDCTTNPSLVLAALNDPDATDLISAEVAVAKSRSLDASALCNSLTVAVGANLAGLVPGRVSTEVNADLSFDVEASVKRAYEIVEDYDRRGVTSDRILIKLASTWEGIKAAERLEKDGINCNLTLLFCLDQAKACADAGAFLISPFVGRIADWHKEADGVADYDPEQDPGVQSVREVFNYYKTHAIKTVVMGASFRNIGQIKALAGCDRLTISPSLLSELKADTHPLSRKMGTTDDTKNTPIPKHIPESEFRWALNSNAMATEKLAEGIRSFDADTRKLIGILDLKL